MKTHLTPAQKNVIIEVIDSCGISEVLILMATQISHRAQDGETGSTLASAILKIAQDWDKSDDCTHPWHECGGMAGDDPVCPRCGLAD